MSGISAIKDSKNILSADALYNLIGSTILKQIPKSIIAVVQLNIFLNKGYLHSLYGLDAPLLYKLISILGLNPVGKNFEITEDGKKYYFTYNHFRKFKGTVYEFAGGQIAEWMTRSAEMLFNIREIYTMAINSEGTPFGTVIVLNRANTSPDFDGLEDFVNDAASCLKDMVACNKKKFHIPVIEDVFKETLLGNLSHEIRTPLNGIIGMLDLLKSEDYIQNKIHDSLFESISTNANDLTRNIEYLIIASELVTQTFSINQQRVSSAQIVEVINQRAKKLLENNKKQTFHISQNSSDNCNLLVDLDKLGFIIEELLLNAIKYSEADIDVYIQTDESFRICITDYGIGMSKREIDVVFHHFTKVSSSNKIYRGLGLGLFICSEIAKMHQGQIQLHSEPKIYTIVTISLPIQI